MILTVEDEWEISCPNCGEDRAIDICAHVWVRLLVDGTDSYEASNQHHDWDDESDANCNACGHHGTVRDFKTEGRDSE